MSKIIYGTTVATPFNPEKITPKDVVKTVNDIAPDENGNVAIDVSHGVDGKSIFYCTANTKATVSTTIDTNLIQNGGKEITVGDLVIAASGWLYEITKFISEDIVEAKFLAVLSVKGDEGRPGSSIYPLMYGGKAEDVVLGSAAVQIGERIASIGDLFLSMGGYLYEFTGNDEYGNFCMKYIAALATKGAPGKDGVSVTHSWNGTVLTTTSASGTSSADLKGEKGDPGITPEFSVTTGEESDGRKNVTVTISMTDPSNGLKMESSGTVRDGVTPVRGVDYWTDEDKEEIVEQVTQATVTEEMIQQVIATLATPVFGRVDENNNIILSGELVNGTYNFMYENADGTRLEIGTLSNLNYVNQIPISTDTDGSIYNGTGYREASRCNSSGAVVSVANSDATNPTFVTGFIPANTGDVIRLKNCFIHATNDDNSALYGENSYGLRSGLYNSAKANICVFAYAYLAEGTDADKISHIADGNGHVTEFTIVKENTAFIRLCLVPIGDPADAIVTVNQVIE